MKRQEVVKKDIEIKQYIEKNKIRAMFSQFTKELLLKKPDDPISYLIEYINRRTKKQISCLQSYDTQVRTRLANIASNKFNFKLIELDTLFKNVDYHTLSNDNINEKVLAELKATESIYKGIIISGYPNNYVQLNFLQKSGIMPDRYFVLPIDQKKLKEEYKSKHGYKDAELLICRNRMEAKEMQQNLGQAIQQLPSDFDLASEKLTSTLGMKAKKSIPYESPRILIVHPPYLLPESASILIGKYSLHPISVQRSLRKLSAKKQFHEFVQKHIRRNGYISKQVELALLETECRTPSAKNKGFLISGWPKTKEALTFLQERFINPHIIFVFDLSEEEAELKFSEIDARNHVQFSVHPKPTIQQYKKELKEFREVVEELKKKQKTQMMKWNDSEKQLAKKFESLMDNSKIYS